MRTKREVLLANGWEPVRGFCFPVPRAEEYYDSTFISEEDAIPVIKEGVQEYWTRPWEKHEDENVYELDDAWETFLDDYSYEHDKEFAEEVLS